MTTPCDESRLRHGFADLGAVTLHYVEAGAPGQAGAADQAGAPPRPLVLLLHGFPEFWYSWRHQLLPLADAGFHVVAPDLRGYNLSSKPEGVAAYTAESLASDIEALIGHFGAPAATLVGHDWGAIVAWFVAMRSPQLVERIAILNGAHLLRYVEVLADRRQRRMSWYVRFFQLPALPELALTAGRCWGVRQLLQRDPVRAGAFSPADIDRYVEALRRPGAARATINSYRALGAAGPTLTERHRRIEHEVLVIWGEQDHYLLPACAEPPPEWVPNCRIVRLPDASHWVQVNRPERVNELLLEFLGVGAGTGSGSGS